MYKKEIHSTVVIGKNFVAGNGLSINAGVTIGNNVSLGDGVTILSGVVIGNNVKIGDDVKIFPNVVIWHDSVIGNRVIINSGSVIGSDGFGFVPNNGKHEKIPHTGNVRIDDDVEIGAINTIDKGTIGTTWIKRGTKTDNLIHIGHNVEVGEDTLIVAQAGIAGSTKVGNSVIIAGQAAISGHLTIGDNTIIGPRAGVVKSHPGGETISGFPELDHKQWLRVQNIKSKLPDLNKRIGDLEKKMEKIEQNS